MPIKTGNFLCDRITYQITGPAHPIMACHCTQCRKQSGHHVAATGCLVKGLTVQESGSLTWFQSSEYGWNH